MIRETVLNRSNGSAFDLWVDMGALEPDTEEEFHTLRSKAIPMHSKYIQPVENGSLEADAILEMLEVRLITVKKYANKQTADRVHQTPSAVTFIRIC